jgi:hypothetical protein
MSKKKQQMPEQLYVYVADAGRDGLIYGCTVTLEEVPEDTVIVGVYERVREAKLVVTRDLA